MAISVSMMNRWHRSAVVAMIAIAVAVTVDPLFSPIAAICVVAVGVILEVALFGLEKA